MNLATPFTIGVRRFQAGATDAHGNAVDSWSTTEKVEVYSIAPAASNEPFEPGRDHVITGKTVLAPSSVSIDSRDRVVIDGEEYEVQGEIGDWTQGPFGFDSGVQINLERVSG